MLYPGNPIKSGRLGSKERAFSKSLLNIAYIFTKFYASFFPGASERRVLLIVGVCETSSHLHTFSSSHIFPSSHLHILTSSHLCIFSSSHSLLLSCPLALLPSCSLLLFYFSLEGAGQCQRDATKCNPFARNEVRSPKTEVKLRLAKCPANPFVRNEARSPKTDVKMGFLVSGRNPFARNEVRSPKIEVKLRCHGFGLCV